MTAISAAGGLANLLRAGGKPNDESFSLPGTLVPSVVGLLATRPDHACCFSVRVVAFAALQDRGIHP
jgi:hypothetical protein